MELTLKQVQGVKIAKERFANHEKYTVIGGYAGTGKSTLVRFLIDELLFDNKDLREEDIVYTSFTGKACTVLQQKGNKNVVTLHKLLYKSILGADGQFFRVPVDDIGYKIVVCDECSMVPKELVDLLLSHNCYIIFCGDPFQLPPVEKETDNHLLDKPHIFLDEIMRQAQESAIIRLSMAIREHKPFDDFKGEDAMVLNRKELTSGMLLWADIVLCATNKERQNMNNNIRQYKGYTKPFEEGEKVICVKNNWDRISDTDSALVNGTIGYLTNIFTTHWRYPYWLKVPDNSIDILQANFCSETGDNFGDLSMDRQLFFEAKGKPTLDNKMKYNIGRNKKTRHLIPEEFAYGYAITCHKSQGSSWDKVLVIEERYPFDAEEHARWLYTAVTRSSSRLVLLR